MVYHRYYVEQLLEHLFVIGQEPARQGYQTVDCHVYLIVGESSVLAVDAGSGASWPFVQATATRYGFADKPIGHVLVTHGHADHARGLTPFEAQGALTVCSAHAATQLESVEDADLIFERDGVLDLIEFAPEAILTPGHTGGCASYRLVVDGQQCLFVGDLVQVDGGLGWSGSPEFSQAGVLASLKKLAAGPAPDWLLAGHGFATPGLPVLQKAIAYGESGRWIPWTEQRPTMP